MSARAACLVGLGFVALLGCSTRSAPRATAEPARTPARAHTGASMTPLANFDSADAAKPWRIVNDDVMGGVSRSRFEVRDGAAHFSGVVSPENGGGFASVRAQLPSVDLAGASTIAIRVRGDGKRYQLRVRTSERWDGPAYKHDFETKSNTWQELELPLSQFVGTFRGRRVADAPPIDASKMRQVGLLIADKQFGPFHLEVAWIRALPAR